MNSNLTEKRDIRRFGITAFLVFGILCALGLWRGKPVPTYLFGVLGGLGLGFMVAPGGLRPLYRAWMKAAHGVGRLITSFLLTLVFYAVITPLGLLKRLFGGDPIPMQPDRSCESYWVEREEPAQPRERFLKRY